MKTTNLERNKHACPVVERYFDNNISERALRRQAVGCKNTLLVGNDAGGRTNAVLTSLIASAHQTALNRGLSSEI